ncbi:hypothetical protein F7725_007664 [Dissostichus mawsoni]|uniref:Uncharacterized protein n=1 Tax=Dissostichus mawsoni TaxID=36200 RepID=A0A7J5Y640_DISMA|nr:hypothetical protein F7725_007664 [Dissostichus mawsoni]
MNLDSSVNIEQRWDLEMYVDITQDTWEDIFTEANLGLEERSKTYLLRILLTVALKCITIKWLKPEPPTYNCWIQRVWDIHHMEQITYLLRLQKNILIKRWAPVMHLLIQ